MVIYLKGVGSHNQGAELMAYAIAQRYREHPRAIALPPDDTVRFAVDPIFGRYEDRAAHGFWTRIGDGTTTIRERSAKRLPDRVRSRARRIRRVSAIGALRAAVPDRMLNAMGLVSERQIDVVLDASGFKFSDQWDVASCEVFARSARRWRRHGKKVILLPQALGPFRSPRIRAAFARLVDNVDWIFARDAQSLAYASDVVGPTPHLSLAPDFTQIVRGVLPPGFDVEEFGGIIVPNAQMLARADDEESEQYESFLEMSAKILIESGLNVGVLVHASDRGDLAIAERLQRNAAGVGLIPNRGVLEAKGILGTARVVVGSRYHALIGALSQGIPGVATSWSHKYQQLYAEYGVPDLLVRTSSTRDEIARLLGSLVEGDTRQAVIARLSQHKRTVVREIEAMWAQVDRVVGWPDRQP